MNRAIEIHRDGAMVRLEQVTKEAPSFGELPNRWALVEMVDCVIDAVQAVPEGERLGDLLTTLGHARTLASHA